MKIDYAELFKLIKNTSFKKVGYDVDYAVVVDHVKKIVYLIFEESSSDKDWKVNFRFLRKCYKRKLYKKQVSCMKCHRGFGQAYKEVNDIIMGEYIQACEENPDYKFIICGWSYGGGMSQIAAEDFNFRTRTDKSKPSTGLKPSVVTFGAPKIFSRKSAKYVREECCFKVVQVAQHNDPVTHVVPWDWSLNLKKSWRVGEKNNFFKWFKAEKYHCNYDDMSLYPEDTYILAVDL